MNALLSTKSRRDVLRYAVAGGALVVAAPLSSCKRQNEVATTSEGEGLFEGQLGGFVVVRPDETILIAFPNPEMGQGVDTSLPMLVADELEVDFEKVETTQMPLELMAGEDGQPTWRYAPQGSGGSYSIVAHWDGLRHAGAFARQLLLSAAAERWSTPISELTASRGVITHKATGRRATYGELAEDAGKLAPPDALPALKSKKDFSVIGTAQKMKNARTIVTGKAVYGIDAELSGMLYTVIERCPYFDGYARSVDDSAARSVEGVMDVIKINRPEFGGPYNVLAEGYAVVANSVWAAMKGRRALKIDWDHGPFADESTESFREQCAALLRGEGQVVRNDGDLESAFASAASTHEASYWQPYVSHATMEPQNCIADVQPNHVRVIGPMQMPSSASRLVAEVLGIDDRLTIEVLPTRIGGGFGRRLSSDYAAEAALVSKAVGKPVQVLWTREDDMRHDFFRPSGMHHLRASFDIQGKLTGWTHRLASASKYYRRPNVQESEYWEAEIYPDDFPANIAPNLRFEYFSARSGAPRGSWRAPAHTANAFAVQSFLDEIAHERGEDPLTFRLRVLGDKRELPYGQHGGPVFNPGRLADCLRLAAERSGFGAALPAGRGRGIAAHFTFGGYVAEVVDVEIDDQGNLRVPRVVAAVDIGTVVNPNGVRAQLESGVNDGLSTVLRLAIHIEGGKVVEGNFDTYQLMRIADAPVEIETHIIDNGHPPSGMGEMGIPPLAPALANAIFQASGKRIRELPIRDQLQNL